ncbi:MAG: heat-inducible transcriptional repressor HrcA [Clostridia bacterium]|nr:heat-inducible transcriptional repressor HrcA [Clostridia bacterium]
MLNERKFRILEAIVKDYIETAEPVGSRTISKKYDLGVSPATIRNEMADLEELGLLLQPHTSAGRIPSELAYRLYVDNMLSYDNLNDLRESIISKIEHIKSSALKENKKSNYLIQEIGKLVSSITNYPVIVSTPKKDNKIKHLELIPVDKNMVVLMLVNDKNMVKTYSINTALEIDKEEIKKISEMLNDHLKGLMIRDINYPLIQTLKKLMGNYKGMLEVVLELIAKMVETKDESEIFVTGANKVFELPEYKDVLKAKTVLKILEEKDKMKEVLDKNQRPGIGVVIGTENKIDEIKDCSLITANYTMNGEIIGTVAILGPTRMDYSQIISILAFISQNMSGMMKRLMEVKYE